MLTGQLRAQRAKLIEDARAIINVDSPTAEVNAQFDTMMDQVDALKAQIDRTEKAAMIEAEMSEVIGEKAERAHVSHAQMQDEGVIREKRILTGLLRGGPRAMTPADREVYAQRIQNTAMSVGTNSAGGYTVAPLFFNELQIAMKAQGGMRAVSRIVTTDTGANLPFPLLDDRSNVASILSENTQATEDTELTFSQTVLGGFTYKTGVMLVSLQLLNDSAFDFDSVIRNAVAGRMVRGQNAHFTTGAGTTVPWGVVPKAALGKTGASGQTATVLYADLVDTLHAVDPWYRPGSTWMLNDATLKVIRKLTTTTGEPIWQAGLIDGQPDRLLGYPVVTNQDMATPTASAKTILFGNFNTYIIRDVATSLQMIVMRERFADYLQVAYLAFMRSDGNLVSAASPIAYYIQAAS